jgi:nitrite reductase/ring-hydroxylating ferredoxin subunit
MKRRISKILSCCFIILICAGCVNKPSYLAASFTNDEFSINESDIVENTPLFFQTNINDISFFIIKVNGKITSYFNACPKCYTAKRGFRVENDHILCRVCDVKYTFDSLETGVASCFPLILKSRSINGKYTIKKDDLIKGRAYF